MQSTTGGIYNRLMRRTQKNLHQMKMINRRKSWSFGAIFLCVSHWSIINSSLELTRFVTFMDQCESRHIIKVLKYSSFPSVETIKDPFYRIYSIHHKNNYVLEVTVTDCKRYLVRKDKSIYVTPTVYIKKVSTRNFF